MKELLMLVMLSAQSLASGNSVAQVAKPKPAEPKIAIVIKAAQTSVKVGSIVEVEVQEMNISHGDVPGGGPFSASTTIFRWDIRDSTGKQVPMTEYGLKANHLDSPDGVPRVWAGSSFSAPLAPGQTITQKLTLSKKYDLSNPGKYTIQAIQSDGEMDVKSNTVTLSVTP